MKTNNIFYFLLLLALVACKPEIEEFSPDKGTADFTTYVSIGGSLTAGYTDGELYRTGQEYSIPNMLSKQFKLAGGGDFKQALMYDELGFGSKRILGYIVDCKDVTLLAPVQAGGAPNPSNFTSVAGQGPFNNFGVPFIKSFMAPLAGFGSLNPYFGRFMAAPTSSVLGDAMAASGTFFTIWLGNDDVLLYALKGGDTGGDSITPVPVFNQSMMAVVSGMIANGAKGAIATIHDIVDIPYFTTVPANGLVLNATQAGQLNAAYAAYNAGAQAMGLPQISFAEGENYWVIKEKDPAYAPLGGLRQIKQGELITLGVPQDSLKCAGWGSQKPIPDYYVLDLGEIQRIGEATTAFNEIITGLATENNLALVDLNAYFKNFKTGMVFDAMKFNTIFVTGGLFSLDGIHLNFRGNAVVANIFIEAINNKFNAKIPLVTIGEYPGIIFP